MKALYNESTGWVTIHVGYQAWQGYISEVPDFYLPIIFSGDNEWTKNLKH